MLKKYIFIFVFLLTAHQLISQNKDTTIIVNGANIIYDSLSVILNKTTVDTSRINILNEISWNYSPTNYKKSIIYADSALSLSKKINWQKGIANALNNLGDALQYKGNIQFALEKHENALKIFAGIKNKKGQAISLAKLGIAYMNLSEFSKSFTFYDRAQKLFRELDDKNGIQKTTTYLGILLYKFKEYDKSLNYYNKALSINEELKDISNKATLYGNIGLTYMELEEYSKAINYYQKALQIFKNINDLYNYSIFLGNIGIAYAEQQEYSKAYLFYSKSLNLSKNIEDDYGIAYQNANIGDLKYKIATDKLKPINTIIKNKLLQESINYLETSISGFSKLGLRKEWSISLFSLSDTYKELLDYEKTFEYFSSAQKIQDTIFSLETRKTIAELEVKQRFKLQEKEIALLNKDKEYQGYVRKSLFAFAAVLLLTSTSIFLLYFKLKKHNVELKKNIRVREEAEEALRKNQIELKKYHDHLELLVKERTFELEKEIQERKQIEEDLLMAIERAETASNAKSIFLANMSHELRTPLMGILGYSDLLSNEIKDANTKEMAEGINRTGNKLLDTLSMVLDLARVESDKFEMSITNVNVIDIIKESYNNFRAVAQSKNLSLNLNLHNESVLMNTDPSMFKIIVDNLVNNAIKFSKLGTIDIKTDLAKSKNNSFLIVKVKDMGIGINKKDIPLIFDEFKQLSEGTIKEFPGTGLGLSITKKYVELLNGKINVESQFGKGSIFIVKFPI